MEWGASRILALRKHAQMTQARFALWLGVTIKQVKYLEHKRRNPSGPTRRLLDILARELRFDGLATVQVLGASPTQLKSLTSGPRPQAPSAESADKGNGGSEAPANPTVHAGTVDTTSPGIVADDAFVWR
jgi:transcriptional regulator with XRE-family HTH domain